MYAIIKNKQNNDMVMKDESCSTLIRGALWFPGPVNIIASPTPAIAFSPLKTKMRPGHSLPLWALGIVLSLQTNNVNVKKIMFLQILSQEFNYLIERLIAASFFKHRSKLHPIISTTSSLYLNVKCQPLKYDI